jgi:plasmid stabilization system protein ParE
MRLSLTSSNRPSGIRRNLEPLSPGAGEGSHLRHTARSESPDNGSAVHISIFGTPQCATNCDSGIPKHLLFYRFDSGEIFVLRVVHGARDLQRLL